MPPEKSASNETDHQEPLEHSMIEPGLAGAVALLGIIVVLVSALQRALSGYNVC